jgi:hypothetical protein
MASVEPSPIAAYPLPPPSSTTTGRIGRWHPPPGGTLPRPSQMIDLFSGGR